MILILLQNAWSGAYAGGTWPRSSWLSALWACPSGRRLIRMLKDVPPEDYWVDNTTPIVGPSPSSVVKPDLEHISGVIQDRNIDYVVACGRQAQGAMEKIEHAHARLFPGIYMPHPAARLLHNKALDLVNGLIQTRGPIERYEVDTWGNLSVRKANESRERISG
jgi:hypothetical protein